MKEILTWFKSVGVENFINDKYFAPIFAKNEQRNVTNDINNENDTINDTILDNIKDIKDLKKYVEKLDHPLKKNALNTVFGHGNIKSPVVFVGEAPGADEDASGLPFVGQSGQLLTNIMLSIGVKREEVYITNVIPWRPVNNKTPSKEEINFFRPILYKHIQLLNPSIIVTLGAIATKAVLNTDEGILSLRGQWQKFPTKNGNYCILPTYHPSYLLRSSYQKKIVWQDFLKLKIKLEEIGVTKN